MALAAPFPPWLNISPETFTGAMSAGGRLGVMALAQNVKEQQAADRLQLAYDQLAQKEQAAGEALQGKLRLGEMAIDARQKQLDIANQATQQRLAEQQAHNIGMEDLAKERLTLGEKSLADREKTMAERAASVSPTQKLVNDYQAAVKRGDKFAADTIFKALNLSLRDRDPLVKAKFASAMKRMHDNALIVGAANMDPGVRRQARKKYDEAEKELNSLNKDVIEPLPLGTPEAAPAGPEEPGKRTGSAYMGAPDKLYPGTEFGGSPMLSDLLGPGAAPGAKTGQGGLTVGTVMKGYRYTGGDPADQNNWEKYP